MSIRNKAFIVISIILGFIISIIVLFLYKQRTSNRLFSPSKTQIVVPMKGSKIAAHLINRDSIPSYELATEGRFIVKMTSTPNSIFNVYDIKSKKKICSFGQIGRASNEFTDFPTNIYIISTNQNRTIMYASDASTRTTKAIDLLKSIKEGKCCIIENIKNKTKANDYVIFKISSDTSFIATSINYDDPRDNIFSQPYISINSKRGSDKIEIYPKLCSFNNYSFLSSIYSSTYKLNVYNKKIVQAYNLIDMFNIINPNDKSVLNVKIKGTYGFDELNKIKSLEEASSKTRICNMDITTGRKYIYILYDGRSIDDFNNGIKYHLSIRKYDWQGNLINVYSISENIYKIAYSDFIKKLFALDINGNILSYDI